MAPESRKTAEYRRIEPSGDWSVFDLAEIWEYRELLFVLVGRTIKLKYKQTLLGVLWVVMHPLVSSLVFAVILGRLAGLPSDGKPYLLFVFSGMIAWNFFASSLQRAGTSLVAEAPLITKVYFPRIMIPLSHILSVLVDFAVALLIFAGLLVVYRMPVTASVLWLPAMVLLNIVFACGFSLWLSALSVYYRDFIHALSMLLQFWMFASPVVYSAGIIPEHWAQVYNMNPMVGVIAGFRWCLLGGGTFPLREIGLSVVVSVLVFYSGATVFKRVERKMTDVI